MDDPELEAIRQRRMQELMAQHGLGNQQNSGQQKAQEDAKRDAEERRQLMLAQVLSSEARERLARIALVKPDKARGVEDVVLRAAQMGQVTEKVSEERLISLLEQMNTQTTKQTKVTAPPGIKVCVYYYLLKDLRSRGAAVCWMMTTRRGNQAGLVCGCLHSVGFYLLV